MLFYYNYQTCHHHASFKNGKVFDNWSFSLHWLTRLTLDKMSYDLITLKCSLKQQCAFCLVQIKCVWRLWSRWRCLLYNWYEGFHLQLFITILMTNAWYSNSKKKKYVSDGSFLDFLCLFYLCFTKMYMNCVLLVFPLSILKERI